MLSDSALRALDKINIMQDPVEYSKRYLNFTPDRCQERVIRAVEPPGSRVIVEACNGPGKTAIASAVALRHFDRYRPSKVVTMSGGLRQNKHQLWSEIRAKANIIARTNPSWKVLESAAHIKTDNPEWFMLGFAAEDVDKVEGWHSPNLLFIVDEAKAVKEEIWNGIDSTLTQSNAKLLIVTVPGDPAKEPHRRVAETRYTHIRIIPRSEGIRLNIPESANLFYTDRVASDWVTDMATHYGIESAVYKQRVLALAVRVAESPYFSDELIRGLFERFKNWEGIGDGLAIDWGRRKDWSVVTEWKGVNGRYFRNKAGVKLRTHKDYMDVIGDINEAHKEHPYRWIIADEGEGRGQIDRMNELGLPVIPFNFGSKVDGAPAKALIMSTLHTAMELKNIGFEHDQSVEDEFNTFESKPTSSGDRLKFEAAEGSHDDIVCSIAMGFWMSTRGAYSGSGAGMTHSNVSEIKVNDLYKNITGTEGGDRDW